MNSEAFKNELAARLVGFKNAVGFPERGGVDLAQRLGRGRADLVRVEQSGDLIENVALFADVGCLEKRAGEHQLPMGRDGFGFEGHDVERVWIVDQAKPALRGDELCDLFDVLMGVGRRKHISWLANLQSFDLGRQGFGMINHMISAKLLHPVMRALT